jgi:hypothetical protein
MLAQAAPTRIELHASGQHFNSSNITTIDCSPEVAPSHQEHTELGFQLVSC